MPFDSSLSVSYLTRIQELLNPLTRVFYFCQLISQQALNYDRSLECFLYGCALNMYGTFSWDDFGIGSNNKSEIDTLFANDLKVDHIYGQLGRLEWQSDRSGVVSEYGEKFQLSNSRPNQSSKEKLIAVANSIKTLSEITSSEDAIKCIDLDSLSSDLLQTKQIHFLGFGYHPQNMRFFSQEYLKCEFDDFAIKAGGTYKGIGKSRQIEIRNEIGSWLYRSKLPTNSEQINFVDCDISDYFKTHF